MTKVAFYKAKHGNLFDKAIAWWTRPNFWRFWESSKYSHVELVLIDGRCFTASNREGRVRTKYIDLRSGHWEIVEVDRTYRAGKVNEIHGAKYDWVGIFLHEFLPLGLQSHGKWWCSEAVAYVLGYDDCRIDPQELYEMVTGGDGA